MEGGSRSGRRIRVYRKFECSRLEQTVLAEAYRRILPNERLKLVERSNATAGEGCNGVGRAAVPQDTDLSADYVTAMGGPS